MLKGSRHSRLCITKAHIMMLEAVLLHEWLQLAKQTTLLKHIPRHLYYLQCWI